MAIDIKKIEDDRQYQVALAQKIIVNDVVLYPGWEVELRGDVVKQHAEAIERATPR